MYNRWGASAPVHESTPVYESALVYESAPVYEGASQRPLRGAACVRTRNLRRARARKMGGMRIKPRGQWAVGARDWLASGAQNGRT